MLLQKMPSLTAGAVRTMVTPADLAARSSRGLVAGTQALIAGVSAGDWFGPGQPLPAIAPPGTEPRAKDYEFAINTQFQTRRTETGISYQQLRTLARSYDLMRLVIETRKDQVAAIAGSFRIRREPGELHASAKAKSLTDPRVKELNDFFRSPDGTGWQAWVRKAMEEVLVVDALSILPRFTMSGKIGRLEIIDGATIDRKIDTEGRTPEAPNVAYQQILKGVPAINLMAPLTFAARGSALTVLPELVYRPRNILADKLYGFSPVEQVVTSVNIALRRQMSQLAFYTDGNINDALISVDESWGATEIKRFQDMYDGTGGQLDSRRRARFLPQWKEIVFPKAQMLKDDFDEWLARIVCYAFSVSPTWATKAVNRATAQQAAETADEEGLAPILDWFEELMTTLATTFWGYADIEYGFDDKVDPDPLKRAQVHQIYLDEEVLTRDEVRGELGRDPLPDGLGGAVQPAPAGEMPAQEKARRALMTKADSPPKPRAFAANGPANAAGIERNHEDHPRGPGATGDLTKATASKPFPVSPDDPLPGRDAAEAGIKKDLAEAYREFLKQAEEDAVGEYEQETPASEIAANLDLSAMDALALPVADKLETVAAAAAQKALKSLGFSEKNLFNLANENAAKWARERGAELVGRKWMGGELVANPDARWAITDTLRDRIRNLVEQAYTDGMTPAQLKTEIQASSAFSDSRAKLVAKTETATASIQGTLEGWKASGVVEGKQSLLSDDHDQDDECNDAADDGVIDVGDTFSTGDDGPPYHPGCNCSIIASLIQDE